VWRGYGLPREAAMGGGTAFIRYAGVALALGIACLSAPAHAQQHGDDPFCASAPLEMLAALEGPWTLRQGAGFAAAGAMVLPLPAHPPQTVVLDYDEGAWYATLTGMAGERMVMFPTDENQIEAVVKYLTEADAANLLEIGAGCDWYSLPLMLGSNSYSLNRAGGQPGTMRLDIANISDGTLTHLSVCIPMHGPEDNDVVYQVGNNRVGAAMNDCALDDDHPSLLQAGEGQLLMNLLVKFQSTESASGIVIFEGVMNGQRFGAKAPVTLSR
jgi:hypothetical protein